MQLKNKVFSNLYQDSVSLMQLSALVGRLPGIEQASVVMGSETNLRQLRDAGLDEGLSAGPNDLIVAVRGEAAACLEALEMAEQQLTRRPDSAAQEGIAVQPATSLEMALETHPAANLALISVPGDYAAAEAIKALNLGLNVMLFSDNVSLEAERQIKTLAQQRELLVMGPDCGTAIINGLPLGFANRVRRGAIGIVAASGTGLQEVSCRIDRLDAGISQALGTGGHDLHELIGGSSMLFSLSMLAQDPATEVIVLISKPPAPAVAQAILARAQSIDKPVVVHFLGAEAGQMEQKAITTAATLADAAEQAVALLHTGRDVPQSELLSLQQQQRLMQEVRHLAPSRRYLRGIFAGGTFCYESQLLCRQQGISASSNTPVQGNTSLADLGQSREHTLIDMGDDDFTRGRPHPMIDPSQRNQRITREIADPETAVVLFDVVLGYGAALDPCTDLLAAIEQGRCESGASAPLLIAHVCGTESDIQMRSQQVAMLQQAGVLVADSNAQAARWAAFVVNQRTAQ